MQGAGGGVGKAEVFVLWEADAVLANHHAPVGLAEAESWATNEKTNRFDERFGDRLKQRSSMNQPTSKNEPSFLQNCLKGGGGGALSWEAGRSEQGRNQVLAGRGSGCLESVGGIWSDEIAGEICQLTRVKSRAGCWGASLGKANRQGRPASAMPARSSTAGLSNQG